MDTCDALHVVLSVFDHVQTAAEEEAKLAGMSPEEKKKYKQKQKKVRLSN